MMTAIKKIDCSLSFKYLIFQMIPTTIGIDSGIRIDRPGCLDQRLSCRTDGIALIPDQVDVGILEFPDWDCPIAFAVRQGSVKEKGSRCIPLDQLLMITIWLVVRIILGSIL